MGLIYQPDMPRVWRSVKLGHLRRGSVGGGCDAAVVAQARARALRADLFASPPPMCVTSQ